MMREPPVLTNLAFEIEMAGVNMVDKMRIVIVDITCRFRLEVCTRLETARTDAETYRDVFGPVYKSAESK